MLRSISRTDLARRTREVLDKVQQGQMVVVESYGEEQIVLLDILDYHILRAVAYHTLKPEDELKGAGNTRTLQDLISAYLDERMSLGKVAQELDISRFELMERFERLGVPLRLGPATSDAAQSEIVAIRQARQD